MSFIRAGTKLIPNPDFASEFQTNEWLPKKHSHCYIDLRRRMSCVEESSGGVTKIATLSHRVHKKNGPFKSIKTECKYLNLISLEFTSSLSSERSFCCLLHYSVIINCRPAGLKTILAGDCTPK